MVENITNILLEPYSNLDISKWNDRDWQRFNIFTDIAKVVVFGISAFGGILEFIKIINKEKSEQQKEATKQFEEAIWGKK